MVPNPSGGGFLPPDERRNTAWSMRLLKGVSNGKAGPSFREAGF